MKTLIILAITILASCGTIPKQKMIIDPRLQDDVINFLVDCERNLPHETCHPRLDISVKVGKLPDPDSLGVCITYEGSWSYVRVIIISADVLSKDSRALVIFHELAHCLLAMEHHDKEIDIMNSYEYLTKTQYINKNWDYFTAIMFERVK